MIYVFLLIEFDRVRGAESLKELLFQEIFQKERNAIANRECMRKQAMTASGLLTIRSLTLLDAVAAASEAGSK